LNKQLVGVAAAGVLCFIASRVNLDYARRYTWWIVGTSLFLLLLVLIPGLGIAVKGSRRWLGYRFVPRPGFRVRQTLLVFCLAHYLAINQTRIAELRRGYLYPLALIGAFVVLIVREPDFGTAALALVVGLTLLFLAGCEVALHPADRGRRRGRLHCPRNGHAQSPASVRGVPRCRGQQAGRHLPALPSLGGLRRGRHGGCRLGAGATTAQLFARGPHRFHLCRRR